MSILKKKTDLKPSLQYLILTLTLVPNQLNIPAFATVKLTRQPEQYTPLELVTVVPYGIPLYTASCAYTR